MKTRFRIPALLAATAIGATPLVAQENSLESDAAFAPKVVVVTMFANETAPWLDGLDLPNAIAVPGLDSRAPSLSCNDDLCVMTTMMGFANAASSMMAVALSDQLDLQQTYFIIAGIAGIDPEAGTLGSAVWVDHVVDGGLFNRIGGNEVPDDWTTTIIELGAAAPNEPPASSAGSEVYAVNPALVARALVVTGDVELADSEQAQEYRALHSAAAATEPPSMLSCATVSADTYWHGAQIAGELAAHAALLTDGEADYCVTQMEDNATLTALHRAAEAGLVDFDRVAILRTASNFDRQHDSQTAFESLRANSGGFGPAIENAFLVGDAFARDIIDNWELYRDGVPQ